ncbi:MAG TPA: diaminopimelate decarboxylase [Bryobacteraceae bacterium]|jgi:diaminopimelate decarboxylase
MSESLASAVLDQIAAQVGTPCFVYSSASILANYRAYAEAFGESPHTVCYAVKANSNLGVLRLLADAGSGFDIVSGGELFRVLKAGGSASKTVFSGVGKSAAEIEYALDNGIFGFNSESEAELVLINELAGRKKVKPRVALRVNPDVDAVTHPYISTGLRQHKFGIDIHEAEDVYARAMKLPNLALESVSCHIGSQILDPGSIHEAIGKMLALVDRLRSRGLSISHLDLGGGLGVAYKPGDEAPSIREFIGRMRTQTAGHGLHLMIEPGRSIVAEAGTLLTRVMARKRNGDKEFVIVDAAMNDLIRPALYQAYHEIERVDRTADRPNIVADIVGPVCETGDFLARDREIPDVKAGELVAVRNVGAYGFAMSSNYNSRPRAAEVLVNEDGATFRIVRRREQYDDLILGE